MTRDQVAVVAIAVACSAGVGVVGLALGYWLRWVSLRWVPPLVAVVAVAAVVAGVVGTAQAMFLSAHDLGVVLVVSAVAAVVAVGFAMAMGRELVRSSRSLRQEARRFGDEGSFSEVPGGPAEFQQLSAELARTSERLREARDREKRLETSRREFVSWVSHDLRTPLAGLRAMSEALEDGMVADEARYHGQMRSEVDRMVRMVDDLFELSRIQAGALPLSVQAVVLGDMVSEALASAEPVARAAGVRLGGAVEEGLCVRGDPAGLARVVANLVSNAIRHTPTDGSVEVRGGWSATESMVELEVRDGCGGIAEDDMARVFDVAWRGGKERPPVRDGGAGLGLAIVKGIVEAHSGRVSVENQDGGCRFLVRLPV